MASINQQNFLSLIQRLEDVTSRLEKASLGHPSDSVKGHENGSASLQDFDIILSGSFKKFLDLSQKIGGDVQTQAEMVNHAFNAQRAFLVIATMAKKPSDEDLAKLLKPTSDSISKVLTFSEANRRSPYFNHLFAISESIPALGWVGVTPAPAPYVKEMHDAGQFYTNRVLKDWKEKGSEHSNWTKAWLACLTELQAFVKQHHTTGLEWNNKGKDAVSFLSKGPEAPTSASGPPPPPPPPPPGLFDDIKAEEDPKSKGRNALFAEINKGEDICKGLKKVTADMQMHKNPSLRDSGPKVVSKVPGAAAAVPKPVAKKPALFELNGKKWAIEYQCNNPNLVIKDTNFNQSVYMYCCEGSTLKVEGKVNNIILDSCKKSAIVFDHVISSCEFINCQSVQMQVMGTVPTISVEKTDGCQMYLSKESSATVIVTSKSSEMNVLIPTTTGDFVEHPIPEQFKTVIQGEKLFTSVSETA